MAVGKDGAVYTEAMTAASKQSWNSDPRLALAHAHAQRAEVLQAELLYRAVLKDHSDCVPAARAAAVFAVDREDFDSARQLLQAAARVAPGEPTLLYDLAQVQWQAGAPEDALTHASALVRLAPAHFLGWMLLGDLREAAGDSHGALRAWYQAVKRAQASGHWLNRESTDPVILDVVMRHIEKLNQGQREYLFRSFDEVRSQHGSGALGRVDKALRGYLGDLGVTPPDPRQRPKFLYIPDLPNQAFHDPRLQPWSERLAAGWQDLRAEAVELLGDHMNFESFLGLKPGQPNAEYVAGSGPNPAWDAFFFYRRGKRFDANHARCPKTSALLDSLTLCRVANQAPEVCFSVIRPGSKIMPHHGVTNSRLVMHLPLVVPPHCALNIVGIGEHHWREGELMMFDDTFQHEAWNNSEQSRVILLMDCWNPHLSAAEQMAVKQLVEAIDTFENA